MKHFYKQFPIFTPWILLLLFIQILFIHIDFKPSYIDMQPLELMMESEDEMKKEDGEWQFKKGILPRLSIISKFLVEMKAEEIPQDGFPELTYDRLNRIVFGQKLISFGLFFLCLLSITSFISWITNAWFRISLNKTLHWVGLIIVFLSSSNPAAHVADSGFALAILLLYLVLFIYLIFSYRAINLGKQDSTRFEVLKHTAELDEEGKKPTQTIEWKPIRVSYHFTIIILVGLLIGNIFYIPLFLLQKHNSYEFGILLLLLLGLLSAFYIRNYYNLSYDESISKWKNILASFSYLQFKFVKNLTMGIGATILIVVFVTVLFSILLANADMLKSPELGIIESSAEF